MKRSVLFKCVLLMGITILLIPSIISADTSEKQVDDMPVFNEGSVHDPSVIKVDDTYYVFGSHLAVAKTDDFMNWTHVASGVNQSNPLFDDVTEELKDALDWAETDTLWAADVVELEDGKFYMYYNACKGDSPLSALGVAVADDVEGPYKDLGIFLKTGMNGESEDGTSYNANIHPNAIDPHTFFDADGVLWMVYGSYSGGIFILEMNSETGFPLEDQGYGTKLMGGNHSRIEGPYIQYIPETEYYYLYTTFGGLDADGGYNMRVARSKNADGPYVDAEGNEMVDVRGAEGSFFDDEGIAPYGVKLMGNYLFEKLTEEPGKSSGYVSPGHNSVFYDEDTKEQFLIFHTRFPNRGEQHEIRVHQMFMNTEGWPAVSPYRYTEEKLEKLDKSDVVGDYKFINHGKDITAEIKTSTSVALTEEGIVSGEVNGTWELEDDNTINLIIDGDSYNGVFLKQWNPTTKISDMTFTALSEEGVAVWGSKSSGDADDSQVAEAEREEKEKEKDAPETVSSVPTILLISLIVLVIGSVIYLVIRQRK